MNKSSIVISTIAIFLFALVAHAQQSDRVLGISLYRSGNFDEAASRLQSATTADKDDRTALIYLGGSYVHLDKHGSAQKAFRKASLIHKDSDIAYDSPVKIISRPRAQTNDTVRRNYNSGTINVAVEMLSSGKIGFVFPRQNFVSEWEPEVIAAAKGIRFQPAVSGGVPVTVIKIVEYSFSIS